MMKKRSNSQMQKDFQRAFQLTDNELLNITRPGIFNLKKQKKRLEMMDEIRRKMKDAIKPGALRKCLFAYNKKLKMSYLEAMRQGKFKEVLADIEALNEGVFI